MIAPSWMAAVLACAQFGGMTGRPQGLVGPDAPNPADPQVQAEAGPAPRPAKSKISAVTVYQGQALVTRDVAVPEGAGLVELVVTPLPPETVAGSLYAEGGEGLRVLSTRFRTRAVKEDTRKEVRAKEEEGKKLGRDRQRLEKEIAVREQDLSYLSRLENFAVSSLVNQTGEGKLDAEAILTMSRFIMDTRGEKARAETDLKEQVATNVEAAEFARRQLQELSGGSSRVERDAVILVQKSRPEAGSIRLGHLVGAANWWPQYRLRGAADDAPIRLEYLAAVVQQTGEAWDDVKVTLSTARPSLDAAPPELLPLKMDVAGAEDAGPVESQDERSRRVVAELNKPVDMPFKEDTPLADVVAYIRKATSGASFPEGIPIYLDPIGLQDVDKTPRDTVAIDLRQVPLRTSLTLLLKQLGLTYGVRDGLLTITATASNDEGPSRGVFEGGAFAGGMGGMGGGMGGMGVMMLTMEQAQASGIAQLNRKAAGDQANEMRVDDAPVPTTEGEKDLPSVSFAIPGTLGIPSRRDPQLLEVGRVELPAEYHAKAVPVLTPRVYRLAKLTNTSDLVILPGEATAYVGTEFVGRMKLPLVAVGEPFVAGFGVDPQVQVSRRLVRKARTVQGGNQVFAYEFRIGLRNYRATPVKVQLWDRLPTPAGEAVVVDLVKTSAELSTDSLYQKTAKADNLLRWDLEVPPGTVGDKSMTLNYEFRLEYARDLPQPHFLSGGLGEAPIGGGAMGTGGMMGGMGGFR